MQPQTTTKMIFTILLIFSPTFCNDFLSLPISIFVSVFSREFYLFLQTTGQHRQTCGFVITMVLKILNINQYHFYQSHKNVLLAIPISLSDQCISMSKIIKMVLSHVQDVIQRLVLELLIKNLLVSFK